ncbi:MAG: hypothetical protein KatS3mg007_1148 [Thermoanaerobaculum sp.]|nr:MAG: hypothetical protein KatS3mg007_1148 [Thermoanaerobaculum sp.]
MTDRTTSPQAPALELMLAALTLLLLVSAIL